MAHRVYLGRLPPTVRQRDIERFFEGYGKVHDIVIKNGFGFLVGDDDLIDKTRRLLSF